MTKVTLFLTLPDDVAAAAQTAGLLSVDAVTDLIERELQHRRTSRPFGIARGEIHLADDFDAPLADMDDYR